MDRVISAIHGRSDGHCLTGDVARCEAELGGADFVLRRLELKSGVRICCYFVIGLSSEPLL